MTNTQESGGELNLSTVPALFAATWDFFSIGKNLLGQVFTPACLNYLHKIFFCQVSSTETLAMTAAIAEYGRIITALTFTSIVTL